MPHYVGLDVSQKTTTICVVDEQGQQLWRGACPTAVSTGAKVRWRCGTIARPGILPLTIIMASAGSFTASPSRARR